MGPPNAPSCRRQQWNFWRDRVSLPGAADGLTAGTYKIDLTTTLPGFFTVVIRFDDPGLAPLFVPLDPFASGAYQKVIVTSSPASGYDMLAEPGSSARGIQSLDFERLGLHQLLATGWQKALRRATSPRALFHKLRHVLRGGGDIVFSTKQDATRNPKQSYSAWQQAFEGPQELARVQSELKRARATTQPPRVLCICSTASPAFDDLLATFDNLASMSAPAATHLLVFHEPKFPLAPMASALVAKWGGQSIPDGRQTWGIEIARAIERIKADLVVPFERPGRFHPMAMAAFLVELLAHPDAVAAYGDHDLLDFLDGRHSPFFKPDWSPEYLRAWNYVGQPVAFRADPGSFAKLDPSPPSKCPAYELLLRLTAEPSAQVRHIPRILFHEAHLMNEQGQLDEVAITEHAIAARTLPVIEPGSSIARLPGPQLSSARRISYPGTGRQCMVSAIIPSKDNPHLLSRAVQSVLDADYPCREIVIVDNGSRGDEQLSVLQAFSSNPAVHVVSDSRPFNFSQLINGGRRASSGQVLLLLNDDVESLDRHWLTQLASLADRSHIGCVGALLLYPNHHVQHAGVILGINGTAGHAFRHWSEMAHEPGLRLQVAHEVSAVTAACLAVRATVFDQVAGFDEAMPVTMNDVDFCLRVSQAGYNNLMAPQACLIHRESTTRGIDATPERLRRLARERGVVFKRWGEQLLEDAYYSPHLTRSAEDFSPRRL